MVARYYVTTTKELETALQAISVTGATVLGLVLTEVDFKQGGYYKKYYKKVYKGPKIDWKLYKRNRFYKKRRFYIMLRRKRIAVRSNRAL